MPAVNKAKPSEDEIRDELTSCFPSYFGTAQGVQTFLEECVKIARYLSNTESLLLGLKGLEATLEQTAQKEVDKVINHYKARAKAEKSTLQDDLRHLLSQQMSRIEIHCGFNSFSADTKAYPTGEKVQIYSHFVPPSAFRAEIANGRHWKDPGVPGNHGEYTHRLQWYLICTQLKAEVPNPAATFRETAKVFGAVWMKEGKPDNRVGLWDAVFDRNGGEAPEYIKFEIDQKSRDGRSPESFTQFITDPDRADEIPILHWFIRSRLAKRKLEELAYAGGVYAYVRKQLKKRNLPHTDEDVWRITGKFSRLRGGSWPADGIFQPGTPITHAD